MVGCALVAGVNTGGLWLRYTILSAIAGDPVSPPLLPPIASYAVVAIYGLPLAFLVGFIFGYPIWALAERFGFALEANAVRLGAGIGFIVGSVFAAPDISGASTGVLVASALAVIASAASGALAGFVAWRVGTRGR